MPQDMAHVQRRPIPTYTSSAKSTMLHVCPLPDDRDPTSSGTTLPQPTAEAQTEYPPTAQAPELEAVGEGEVQPEGDVFPEAEATDLPVASSDVPEVTTTAPSVSTGSTQASSMILENSQVTTITASSTQEPSTIPEATTSNPDDSDINTEDVTAGPQLQDIQDPSISVSPAEPDALTTNVPSSTDAVQDDTAGGVTADPLNVTPALSDATSKPQDKPEPSKPSPAKPGSSKPETKPVGSLTIDDSRDYQAGQKCSYHQKTNCIKVKFCNSQRWDLLALLISYSFYTSSCRNPSLYFILQPALWAQLVLNGIKFRKGPRTSCSTTWEWTQSVIAWFLCITACFIQTDGFLTNVSFFFPQMTATTQICAAGGPSAEPLRWRTERLLFSEVSANQAAATRVCSQWIYLQILSCVYPDSSLTFEGAEGISVCLFTQELGLTVLLFTFSATSYIKWKYVTFVLLVYIYRTTTERNSTFTYCK